MRKRAPVQDDRSVVPALRRGRDFAHLVLPQGQHMLDRSRLPRPPGHDEDVGVPLHQCTTLNREHDDDDIDDRPTK